jgi:hypothetical protein
VTGSFSEAIVDKSQAFTQSAPLHKNVTHDSDTNATPSVASYSHIHRLVEPASTRKKSKREDIILLKASMVNGFKCPPWDKNPLPSEFVAQQDTELFVYMASSSNQSKV